MYKPFKHFNVLITTVFFSAMLLSSVSAQQGITADSKKYQRSIDKISQEIKDVSRNLNANKALAATQRDKLLKIEQQLNASKHLLRQADKQLAKSRSEYQDLLFQLNQVQQSQEKGRDALKLLIKSRYVEGKPEPIKNVLNQENPYAVGRLANYHRYFSAALKSRFESLGKKSQQLSALKAQQSELIQALELEQEKQQKISLELQNVQKQRAQVIASLDKKIASTGQKLAQLKDDRKRLNSLLRQLKKQAAELKRLDELRAKQEAERRHSQQQGTDQLAQRTIFKGGFSKQKGKLNYPVNTKPKRTFGSRLPESGMRSEGTFFETGNSVDVKSIFRGRVLFADFLKGYGLLLIVDHGDDHISLYGHNARLFKKVGDSVATNETIAKTGVTGGLKSHGLYFEIRNNASPVDASLWCN